MTVMEKKLVLIKPPTVLKAETVLISCQSEICVASSAEKSSILAIVKSGELEISCTNQVDVFRASRMSLLALSADREYTLRATGTEGFELLCLHLVGVHYRHEPEGDFPYAIVNPVIESASDEDLALRLMEAIFRELEGKRRDWRQVTDKLCEAMFLDIHRRAADEPDADTAEAIVSKICLYIEENYSGNISLNDLSAIVFVSPYHLSHIFKASRGVSPIQYLIGVRIERAKEMLKNTTLSVAEIAAAVGYPNTNYFNDIFKRSAGVTPGRFRKNASEPRPLHDGFFSAAEAEAEKDGKPATGIRVLHGKTYFFNEKGEATTGWQDTEQGRMYFLVDGAAATGLTRAGGAWYYFDENHHIVTGLTQVDGHLYFFKPTGEAKRGWHKLEDGNWMYFGSDGRAVTGWLNWRDNWYFLGDDHIMLHGLVELNGNQYYLDPGVGDGALLTGLVAIGDNEYFEKYRIRLPQES